MKLEAKCNEFCSIQEKAVFYTFKSMVQKPFSQPLLYFRHLTTTQGKKDHPLPFTSSGSSVLISVNDAIISSGPDQSLEIILFSCTLSSNCQAASSFFQFCLPCLPLNSPLVCSLLHGFCICHPDFLLQGPCNWSSCLQS